MYIRHILSYEVHGEDARGRFRACHKSHHLRIESSIESGKVAKSVLILSELPLKGGAF